MNVAAEEIERHLSEGLDLGYMVKWFARADEPTFIRETPISDGDRVQADLWVLASQIYGPDIVEYLRANPERRQHYRAESLAVASRCPHAPEIELFLLDGFDSPADDAEPA